MVELNEKQCADIEKIDTPEKKEQESAQVEKRTERKQKKAISDYRKSLISIAEVVKLTQMPAWSRIVEKLETDMKIADGGLHDGKKADFDTNQAMYQTCRNFFNFLSDLADQHNALVQTKPGEIPLASFYNEELFTVSFDKEKKMLSFEDANNETVTDEVLKELQDSLKSDEGSTND